MCGQKATWLIPVSIFTWESEVRSVYSVFKKKWDKTKGNEAHFELLDGLNTTCPVLQTRSLLYNDRVDPLLPLQYNISQNALKKAEIQDSRPL